MFESDDEAQLSQSVANVQKAASEFLGDKPSLGDAVGFATQIQSSVDKVVSTVQSNGVVLACKQGCSHCCHVRVEALEPEVFKIAGFLTSLPSSALEAFKPRLTAHAQAVEDMGSHWERTPCPFLENQKCLIYPIRPAVCRKGHSLDVGPCESHAATLPQSVAIVAKSEAIIQGAALAYEKAGLSAGGNELGTSVLKVLNSERLAEKWLKGEAVFQGNSD